MKVASQKKSNNNKRLIKVVIPFEGPESREYNKNEVVSFKLRSTPNDQDSPYYEKTIPIFGFRTPEEVLIFVKDLKEVLKGQNATTGPAKYALICRVLTRDALAAFDTAAAEAGNETNNHFETTLQAVIKDKFHNRAYKVQRRIMCRVMR